MRISVKENNRRIFIPIPSRLLFNSLTARLIGRYARPYVTEAQSLTPQDCRKLFRALHQSRRILRGEYLIEAVVKNGTEVRIRL